MVTTILVVLLSTCVILLAREILKLKERLNTLHNETNNRISVTDQQLHLRITKEYEELLHTMKETSTNSDDIRERRLKELREEILKLIPPTNDELLERIKTMEEESYRLRMSM